VTKFALVKSTLTPAGPAYQILEEFSLAPASQAQTNHPEVQPVEENE
jgi:hypothetical protein